jgi:hypothetical protein
MLSAKNQRDISNMSFFLPRYRNRNPEMAGQLKTILLFKTPILGKVLYVLVTCGKGK